MPMWLWRSRPTLLPAMTLVSREAPRGRYGFLQWGTRRADLHHPDQHDSRQDHRGFAVCTVGDIEELYDLMLKGEIRPAYEEIPFDRIGGGLERLKNNEVMGRLVARWGD